MKRKNLSYRIKELEVSDFERYPERHQSFLLTLSRWMPGNLSKNECINYLKDMNAQKIHVFVAVDNDSNEIIGSLSTIVEQKFIRHAGKSGHIEDVVTRRGYERNGIATALRNKAKSFLGLRNNDYKEILDCDKSLIPHYEQGGFKVRGVFMGDYNEFRNEPLSNFPLAIANIKYASQSKVEKLANKK